MLLLTYQTYRVVGDAKTSVDQGGGGDDEPAASSRPEIMQPNAAMHTGRHLTQVTVHAVSGKTDVQSSPLMAIASVVTLYMILPPLPRWWSPVAVAEDFLS